MQRAQREQLNQTEDDHSQNRHHRHPWRLERPLELEDESRMRREHALLFSIINAATDPMLLTNMEGQLIIANARAEIHRYTYTPTPLSPITFSRRSSAGKTAQ